MKASYTNVETEEKEELVRSEGEPDDRRETITSSTCWSQLCCAGGGAMPNPPRIPCAVLRARLSSREVPLTGASRLTRTGLLGIRACILGSVVVQNTAYALVRRYSRGALRETYSTSSVLLVMEVAKMALSAFQIVTSVPTPSLCTCLGLVAPASPLPTPRLPRTLAPRQRLHRRQPSPPPLPRGCPLAVAAAVRPHRRPPALTAARPPRRAPLLLAALLLLAANPPRCPPPPPRCRAGRAVGRAVGQRALKVRLPDHAQPHHARARRRLPRDEHPRLRLSQVHRRSTICVHSTICIL